MAFFSKKNKLFPSIEPFDTGFIKKGIHEIYYEQSGNPKGKPAIFLHGGPGGGGGTLSRRFFNPKKYRIVVFDQRGCGRSKPHASLEDNTTWHLVDDIESIREKLEIEKWLVFGGSWGSTLSLAYAQKFPDRVSELILRGIFMLRQKELEWFYQYGASEIYPEAWQGFLDEIKPEERSNLMEAYRKIFNGEDQEKKLKNRSITSCMVDSVSNSFITEEKVADKIGIFFKIICCNFCSSMNLMTQINYVF